MILLFSCTLIPIHCMASMVVNGVSALSILRGEREAKSTPWRSRCMCLRGGARAEGATRRTREHTQSIQSHATRLQKRLNKIQISASRASAK
jgi:hypothetical protein